jgi:UDP-N-acetylglucosamine acyltransferase
MAENVEKARAEFSGSPNIMKIVDFLSTREKRYFIVPPLKVGGSDGNDED